jgi:hypothetical protein
MISLLDKRNFLCQNENRGKRYFSSDYIGEDRADYFSELPGDRLM